MTVLKSLFVGSVTASFVVLSAGCAAREDRAADQASALSTASPFCDESASEAMTIDGIAALRMRAPKAFQDGPLADLGSWVNFGVEYVAYTARMTPAESAELASDPMRLAQFADKMTDSPTETPNSEITIKALERKDVFSAIVSSMQSGDPWPERHEFEKTLRVVLPSLLAKPTSHVFQVTYCPDWCNEATIAVTTDGEVRLLIAFGDV